MNDLRPIKRLERRHTLCPTDRLLASLILVAMAQASAEIDPWFIPDPGGRLPHPEQVMPWLDEVRAQRRAWEQDLRKRRAERQERIEQERAAFRRLGPEPWGGWSFMGPWPAPSESPLPSAQSPAQGPLGPPNWDNLWYFRGY